MDFQSFIDKLDLPYEVIRVLNQLEDKHHLDFETEIAGLCNIEVAPTIQKDLRDRYKETDDLLKDGLNK